MTDDLSLVLVSDVVLFKLRHLGYGWELPRGDLVDL
jgi:hypothetical protein